MLKRKWQRTGFYCALSSVALWTYVALKKHINRPTLYLAYMCRKPCFTQDQSCAIRVLPSLKYGRYRFPVCIHDESTHTRKEQRHGWRRQNALAVTRHRRILMIWSCPYHCMLSAINRLSESGFECLYFVPARREKEGCPSQLPLNTNAMYYVV